MGPDVGDSAVRVDRSLAFRVAVPRIAVQKES